MASEILRIKNCDGELVDVEISDSTRQPEAPLMLARIGPGVMPDHEAEAERLKALAELRAKLHPSQ